jgi:hypothetical protein
MNGARVPQLPFWGLNFGFKKISPVERMEGTPRGPKRALSASGGDSVHSRRHTAPVSVSGADIATASQPNERLLS